MAFLGKDFLKERECPGNTPGGEETAAIFKTGWVQSWDDSGMWLARSWLVWLENISCSQLLALAEPPGEPPRNTWAFGSKGRLVIVGQKVSGNPVAFHRWVMMSLWCKPLSLVLTRREVGLELHTQVGPAPPTLSLYIIAFICMFISVFIQSCIQWLPNMCQIPCYALGMPKWTRHTFLAHKVFLVQGRDPLDMIFFPSSPAAVLVDGARDLAAKWRCCEEYVLASMPFT